MTYSVTTLRKSGGGLEYGLHWKGNFQPIAVCGQYSDAQRIADALNAVSPASGRPALDWHRVEDQMPDDDMLVLVYVPPIDQMVMAAHANGKWYSDDSIIIKTGITHWCDPAPPTPNPKPQTSN